MPCITLCGYWGTNFCIDKSLEINLIHTLLLARMLHDNVLAPLNMAGWYSHSIKMD